MDKQLLDADLHVLSFDPGPLYSERFKILQELYELGLQTGDILYRASDARGPFNLPFSRIVARVTKSLYSHAAIVYIEHDEYFVLEINDRGTLLYRMIDWLDTNYTKDLAIYRLKNITEDQIQRLKTSIKKVMDSDPDYDFTFSNPNLFYCTESIVMIHADANDILIDEGYYLNEVVPCWLYYIIQVCNPVFKLFNTSLPLDQKLYFVGNEEKGMMASPLTECIYLRN